MRLLEKLIISTFMLLVLIYTVHVNRSLTPRTPVPIPKTEKPIEKPPVSPVNEDSFFPPPEPPLGEKDIIEESFTELP
ncbi:MAG: hypothetical protein NPINA01_33050 [Nitrospinaceae bacterium]|nr:MAG: hypothetical protein NPINA01_33050 [Nitrospinaceae bacterium]